MWQRQPPASHPLTEGTRWLPTWRPPAAASSPDEEAPRQQRPPRRHCIGKGETSSAPPPLPLLLLFSFLVQVSVATGRGRGDAKSSPPRASNCIPALASKCNSGVTLAPPPSPTYPRWISGPREAMNKEHVVKVQCFKQSFLRRIKTKNTK